MPKRPVSDHAPRGKSKPTVSRGPTDRQRRQLAALARRSRPPQVIAGLSAIVGFGVPLLMGPSNGSAAIQLIFLSIALIAIVVMIAMGAPFRRLRKELNLTPREAAEMVKAERGE